MDLLPTDRLPAPRSRRSSAVVTRLAPSPTGLLHLGHAFSLLVAFWYARSQGGKVILRLDDIDVERAEDKYFDTTIEDLKWLGLDWDDKEVVASTRKKQHLMVIDQLVELGWAYPCVCSRKDVHRATGAPQQGQSEAPYPQTCKGRFENRSAAQRTTGKPASLRFCTPFELQRVEDLVYGNFEENVARTAGDFIIQRRSAAPAYQLGVVVDDELDQISHVIRGRDLLPSTLRQELIRKALGWTPLNYAHVPLICDHNGRRLAKRHEDLSLAQLREEGTDPGIIVSWAARVAGQQDDAPSFSARSLIDRFELARLVARDISLPEHPRAALLPGAAVFRI